MLTVAKLVCALSVALPALAYKKAPVFDVQGHRGSRGETVESTLPAFASALIDGVTTLEMDNGITKDGVVIVWHDEVITGDKCTDTKPAFKNDPLFPYVGKNVANLTLAQVKTLDCGSKRLYNFPLQNRYPGVKLSTMDELFKFVQCADSGRTMQFNIESKINPVQVNQTAGVNTFVSLQRKAFKASGYKLSQITYQSFDWRTLIAMRALEPTIPTAALIDPTTTFGDNNTTSLWLGGLRLQDFPGATLGEQIAYAAKSIKANIVSAAAVETGADPTDADYKPFTTAAMIKKAHQLGLAVKPWTVNRLNIAEQLIDWDVDGIITDYPRQMHRLAVARGETVPTGFPESKVLSCLAKHIQKV